VSKKIAQEVLKHQTGAVNDSVAEVIRLAGLSDMVAQLNEKAISAALEASITEERSATKFPTTVRVPLDVHTFYRVWGEAMGVSSQQIVETVLRGYYDNLLANRNR
jgi:hypothetical protein